MPVDGAALEQADLSNQDQQAVGHCDAAQASNIPVFQSDQHQLESPDESSITAPAELSVELSKWGIGEYAEALERDGYDLQTLRDIEEAEEVDEMLRAIGCSNPEHVQAFRSAMSSDWQAGLPKIGFDSEESLWKYRPSANNLPMAIRAEPVINGERSSHDLFPEDVFRVSQIVRKDGVRFLKLKDGRGWTFDVNPGRGTMCVRIEAGAEEYQVALLEDSAVAQAVKEAKAMSTRLELAEAYVSSKEIESTARVEVQRTVEAGLTERTRVVEEAQTQRVNRMSAVTELAIEEGNRTDRERIIQQALVQREAMAAKAKLEAARIKSRRDLLNLGPLTIGWLSGIAAKGSAQQVVARSVFPQYIIGILVFIALRKIWQKTRKGQLNDSLVAAMVREQWDVFAGGVLRKTLESMQEKFPALKDRLEEFIPRSSPDNALAILAPEEVPDEWISHEGPGGRVFWHNTKLGPPPWEASAAPEDQQVQQDEQTSPDESVIAASSDLRAHLSNWGVGEYAEALQRAGYDLKTLRLIEDAEEVNEMLAAIGCSKPEHVQAFRLAMFNEWQTQDS